MIGFIPRLAVSSHVLESRHKGGGFKSYTPSRPSLGPLAAELAVRAGKTAATAIRFLEQARGLLSTSFEELRSDLRELQSFHPELADRFTQLRELLDQPSVPSATRLRGEMQARYHTGTEFDDLIAEIRSRDGFENFLSAPSETQMKLAAANGPIVVINVGIISCYALIIEKTRIRPLYLARIRPPHLKRLVEMGITRPAVLRRLWDVMMKPILISLGFTGPPLDGESYPHVWWIPTGILSKFPLHAAGHHAPGSTETVMDWVMSSYSSSVKAIVNGRRRALGHLARSRSDAPLHAILVAMDSTPGLSGSGALPFAVGEVNSVKGLCESMSMKVTNIQSLKRKKSELLSLLPGCAIFHFAGHGKTNDKDPSESCLLLNDWEEDPLTVGSLFEQNLCEKAPFLAYLSACSTGEIQGTEDRQEVLMDDSIHLISACQIAGFRHVIGTLWTVNDRSCLDVARFTYEELARAESGLADEAVCRGLHRAVKRLRDRWLETYESDEGDYVDWDKEMAALISPDHRKRGNLCSDDDSDSDDGGNEPLYWVPYVHFGV
ncbi:hypothetical protein GQ53DRAFT_890565 [Thozetella sp. PMI_491]|nr:hypothetical protein GQ53DRAFT_890565 [Thozetella sp. PMI_491]